MPAISAAATWPKKIASGKFHGEIATKTPRPRRRSTFELARRPGHRLPGPEQAAALRRVIAGEIDRLADLRERVVEGLAALDLQQVDEPPAPRLEEVRGALERRRPLCRRASRSRRESPARAAAIASSALADERLDDFTDDGAVGRAEHIAGASGRTLAVDDGRGA